MKKNCNLCGRPNFTLFDFCSRRCNVRAAVGTVLVNKEETRLDNRRDAAAKARRMKGQAAVAELQAELKDAVKGA